MNCKPDQLAVVNWPGTLFHNCIVTTKEIIPVGSLFTFLGTSLTNQEGVCWWVECGGVQTTKGNITRFPVYDRFLRPIGTPEHGGVEQNTFQRPLPTLAETITGALNRMKYGSQS